MNAVAERVLEQMRVGEVFSLNPKARRLVLASIDDAKDRLVVTEHIPGRTGRQHILSWATHRGHPVTVWAEEEVGLDESYQEFDRVRLKGTKIEGTVVSLNETKFPDCDIIVKWDEVIHGDWVSEVHPHEIQHMGTVATGDQRRLAQEVRSMVRERQDAHSKGHEDKTRQVIKEELEQRASRREAWTRGEDRRARVKTHRIAQAALDLDPTHFRRIVEAGVLAATAGDRNYEIGVFAEVLDDYRDDVAQRVARVTQDMNIQVSATLTGLQILSHTMLDQFFLTREGYVRETEDGRWGVYTRSGHRVGMHGAKAGAVRQMRAIEIAKRGG